MFASSEPDPAAARTGMTPEERHERAALAAHRRWGTVSDRVAELAPARAGFVKKLEDQIDPDRQLPADVLAKRVENLRQAHMHKMCLAALKASRLAKEKRQAELQGNSGGDHAA
jgi:hypothetical protein